MHHNYQVSLISILLFLVYHRRKENCIYRTLSCYQLDSHLEKIARGPVIGSYHDISLFPRGPGSMFNANQWRSTPKRMFICHKNLIHEYFYWHWSALILIFRSIPDFWSVLIGTRHWSEISCLLIICNFHDFTMVTTRAPWLYLSCL